MSPRQANCLMTCPESLTSMNDDPTMNECVEMEWLRRRWSLPDPWIESAAELLRRENEGSTAVEIRLPLISGGPALNAGGSPLVAVTSAAGKTYLQTRRMHHAEQVIASRILKLASVEYPGDPSPELVDALFPDVGDEDPQRRAAIMACRRALGIISGGPGTGKTHTIARILALLVSGGMEPGRIRMAAPTGKAADRMKKAVADSLSALPGSVEEHKGPLAGVAESARTIHQLLGYNPDSRRCFHNASNRIPCRALIIDECSMVDIFLWKALMEALPDDARLILVGDPDQLESVGQGNVLAELTAFAASQPVLAANHVRLTRSRRFQDSPGITAFADAIKSCDTEKAKELLAVHAMQEGSGLNWIPMEEGIFGMKEIPSDLKKQLAAVANASTPNNALEELGRICILTAQREHFVGAKAIGEKIDAMVLRNNPAARNRPVIINRNDPETGLKNGAVGVIHAGEDGGKKAYFRSAAGELRDFPVAKLPDHQPAWAITIHRSQGSEYDSVLVIVPRADSPMATRSLLYTAITRAKKSLYVAGDLESIAKAINTPSNRVTLLADSLTKTASP